eukprot:7881490-Karenia_brevis.AAC.1
MASRLLDLTSRLPNLMMMFMSMGAHLETTVQPSLAEGRRTKAPGELLRWMRHWVRPPCSPAHGGKRLRPAAAPDMTSPCISQEQLTPPSASLPPTSTPTTTDYVYIPTASQDSSG